ncbi:MAG: histidine kinase [Saprospiraceae bacterium]|nr:histidine kinase [Saprospiraceae bacterium]
MGSRKSHSPIWAIAPKSHVYTALVMAFTALTSLLNAQQIPLKHFTIKDGLPSNNCYRLIDDAEGKIWVATDKGIVRYNGYEFESIAKKLNFKIKDIYNCFPDDGGRMWLDTKDQRKKFILGDSLVWVDRPELPSRKDRFPVYYPGNGLFFTSRNYEKDEIIALRKYDNNNIYYFPIQKEDRLMMVKENDHNITVVTLHFGVQLLDKNTGKVSTLLKFDKDEKLLSDNHNFYHPRYYGRDQYIFATNKNVYLIGKDRIHTLFSSKEIEGHEMVGYDEGWLILHEPVTGKFSMMSVFGVKKSLHLPAMPGDGTSLVVDKEKNWWISSKYSGVFFIPQKSFKSRQYFEDTDEMATPKITQVGSLPTHGLYMINDNFNYFYLRKDKQIKTVFRDLYSHLYNLQEDKFGQIITGNFSFFTRWPMQVSGLNSIQPQTNCEKNGDWYYTRPYMIPKKRIVSKDTKGYFSPKYVCQLTDTTFLLGGCLAIIELTTQKGKIKMTRFEKPKECIYSILKLKNGHILLGTTEGIYHYADQKMGDKWLPGYVGGFIRSMAQDDRGRIWLSSDEKGLMYIDEVTQQPYVFPDFENSIINQLYFHKETSTMWVASSNGLWRAKPNGEKGLVFQKYTYSDGIHANDINSVFCLQDSIYIGTSEGLTAMQDLSYEQLVVPTLEISDVRIDGVSRDIQSFYELDYHENSIHIQLTNLSYASLGDNTYEYELNGDGTHQTEKTKDRTIQFNNLAPGRYSFKARAYNVYGVKSKNEILIHFNIKPIFYNTLWFRLIMAIAFVSIPFFYFYYRNKRKLLASEKELALQKKMAEIKLESLQSQLNSHFIFNSLNAIQNYIFTNEEVKANEYLSKFSRLIRGYLEASKKQFIGLFEEIDLLQLYLSLESLRSGEHFEYSISIEEDLDNSVQIPSNIIQPFVENAIEHGLKNKEGKGHLRITWRRDGKSLVCTVEDDGIGRELAQQIRKNHLKKQSLGIKIIRERINAIKEFDRSDIEINIADLHPGVSNKGTKVTIKMPLRVSIPPG